MGRGVRIHHPGLIYHVINRGNNRQAIFLEEADYRRYLDVVYRFKKKYEFQLYAYCLMTNHVHLLIRVSEKGSISKFMQKLTTAYSMYFNNKYKRTGTLFEGKFKAEHINKDTYLKYLFSYIHLNPIKLIDSKWKEDGIKNKRQVIDFLRNYKYSSYQDYLGINRQEKIILNRDMFPEYFPTKKFLEKEIFEWLTYRQDL